MTKVFLIVSVACNVWFLLMLLSDRITETKFVRFLKGAAGLWRSLGTKSEKQDTLHSEASDEDADIIGKSRFRMAPTRQPLPYRRKKQPFRKKAMSCRKKRLLLTTETRKPHRARHKSRRINSMKPSRAYRRRNWNTERMSRRMMNRARDRLREVHSRTSTWQYEQ